MVELGTTGADSQPHSSTSLTDAFGKLESCDSLNISNYVYLCLLDEGHPTNSSQTQVINQLNTSIIQDTRIDSDLFFTRGLPFGRLRAPSSSNDPTSTHRSTSTHPTGRAARTTHGVLRAPLLFTVRHGDAPIEIMKKIC